MSRRRYHLHKDPIPPGFQIYTETQVVGTFYRLAEATAFAKVQNARIVLERECHNAHDKNAIRVMGGADGWLGPKWWFVGYVSKELARRIVEGGWFMRLRPRLKEAFTSDNGRVFITFQLLGPKGGKYEFLGTCPNKRKADVKLEVEREMRREENKQKRAGGWGGFSSSP